jgi:hypothetical protein
VVPSSFCRGSSLLPCGSLQFLQGPCWKLVYFDTVFTGAEVEGHVTSIQFLQGSSWNDIYSDIVFTRDDLETSIL